MADPFPSAPSSQSETSNGEKPSVSPLKQIADLIDDHVELAMLEGEMEFDRFATRLVSYVVGGVFGITAYILLQVGIIHGLVRLGLPLWAACFILVAVYGLVAILAIAGVRHRDPRLGIPFQGTREEWRRSKQWIQKRFF